MIGSSRNILPADNIRSWSSIIHDRVWTVNRLLSVTYPYLIGVPHDMGTIPTMIPVEVVYVNHPVRMYNMVMPVIDHDSGTENIPTALYPWRPPGRVIMPAVRRNIHLVTGAYYVLHRLPVIYIHIISITRIISSAVTILPNGFNINFLSIEIFVSYDLKDCSTSSQLFNFDNGHVLFVIPAELCL